MGGVVLPQRPVCGVKSRWRVEAALLCLRKFQASIKSRGLASLYQCKYQYGRFYLRRPCVVVERETSECRPRETKTKTRGASKKKKKKKTGGPKKKKKKKKKK